MVVDMEAEIQRRVQETVKRFYSDDVRVRVRNRSRMFITSALSYLVASLWSHFIAEACKNGIKQVSPTSKWGAVAAIVAMLVGVTWASAVIAVKLDANMEGEV